MALTKSLRLPWLYMVTPSVPSTSSLVDKVEKALQGGVNVVQLRNKIYAADSAELKSMAVALRDLTRAYKVPLIINDHVSLALEIGADGAHIGQEDTSVEDAKAMIGSTDFILGVTVRDAIQANAACKAGATYLGVGPVYASSTKQNANDGVTIGLEGLRSVATAAQAYNVPVVAIGGISLNRVKECMEAEASGVAVVAALSNAPDIHQAASEMAERVFRSFIFH
ncbi:hypothetical protein LEN26_005508 [Aphanomyces euteiches]|nr:hypothetical protein AeMF1_009118 [Aphanomyces euteiches]KAH9137924.1 hypothetical protein LEN26_005508 [Aphanomyces euteiches]KAH9197955.1 hypothetical protein AeNC1_000046 [Aphanomyces euteiches]